MSEVKSKIIGPIFWFFYIVLIIISAFGLYSTGLSNVGSTVFYFVLLGLFLLPMILRFIPSLESLNIFGVELKFKKELEDAKRHILDLEQYLDPAINNAIFKYIKEEYLSTEGKNKLKEWQEELNEK